MTIPQPYNLTLMSNSTGIVNLWQNVNTNILQDTFGIMILITIFAMAFLSFIWVTQGKANVAFIGSSFICFVLSFLLRAMELVNDAVMYSALAILAIAIAFMKPRE